MLYSALFPAPPLHSKGYLENDAETEEEVESDEEYVLSPRPAHEDSSESEWYSCNRQCERLLLVFHYNFSPNATPVHLVTSTSYLKTVCCPFSINVAIVEKLLLTLPRLPLEHSFV